MAQKPNATIIDVANAAGVSVSTVSRILNGKPDVAPATRARVLEVIEEVGWVPHAQAKRLKEGQSRTIALLDPVNVSGDQAVNQVHLDFMIGAANAAATNSYFLNVLTAPVTEDALTDLYRGAQVDGVIFMEVYLEDWRVETAKAAGLPFVMIGRQRDNAGSSFLDLDFAAAAEGAVQYLADLGHRKVAFLGFPERLRNQGHGPAVRGWEGFHRATTRLHLHAVDRESEYSAGAMEDATHEVLDAHPDVTAIVALTDAPLVGVFNALRERDVLVPETVSVVGIAVDRIAELLTPRLTAFRFPSYDMGYQAVSMLVEQLQTEGDGPHQVVLPPELIVRESAGPAPT